jgi:hypothetical protein
MEACIKLKDLSNKKLKKYLFEYKQFFFDYLIKNNIRIKRL